MPGEIMQTSIELIESAARFGLQEARDNLESAQLIAESTYRSHVRRELLITELQKIRELIEELQIWQKSAS